MMDMDTIYDLVCKASRRSTMADCVSLYWSLGYREWHDFPKEYFFMRNPHDGKIVRIYYSGRIWEK